MRLTYVRIKVTSVQAGIMASAWCVAPATSEAAVSLWQEVEREHLRLIDKAGGYAVAKVQLVIDTINGDDEQAEDAPRDMQALSRIRGLVWRYERRHAVKETPGLFRWRKEVRV